MSFTIGQPVCGVHVNNYMVASCSEMGGKSYKCVHYLVFVFMQLCNFLQAGIDFRLHNYSIN